LVDDSNEQFTGAQSFPNWSSYIENANIIVFNGRANEYNYSEPFEDYGTDGEYSYGDTLAISWDDNGSEFNGEWDCPNPDECEAFLDYNGDGVWTSGSVNSWYISNNTVEDNYHLKGSHYYDEELVTLLFDVFTYDLGEDGRPGDYAFYNTVNDIHYGFIDGVGNNEFEIWEGGNSLIQGPIPTEGCSDADGNILWGNGQCGDWDNGLSTDVFNPEVHDCGLDGLCPEDEEWESADYGEGNGVWDSFDWNNNGSYDDGDIWDSSSWEDDNDDGIPDVNEFSSWQDTYPYGNNEYNSNDQGDLLLDCGQDGLCFGDEGYEGADSGEGDGIWQWDNGEGDGIQNI